MYGLGQMMQGGSAADGAPQMPPGLFGNMGGGMGMPQGGNSIAQMLLQGRGQGINPMGQQQAPQIKKGGLLEMLMVGGGLGILPAHLSKM